MPAAVSARTSGQPWAGGRPRRARRRRYYVVWAGLIGLGLLVVANWAYHVARKPTELLAPVSPAFAKTPRATWDAYGHLFGRYSTDIVSPELLAALAQVEAKGNPITGTYWRWQWALNPFDIYRPASSAVGMFQITNGTFEVAKRYCIRHHAVVSEGPWYDVRSCWFNSLYSRIVPSHAVELTSSYLHQSVADTLARHRVARTSSQQRENLAAVIHLCGTRRGESFARRGFQAMPGERCGDHGLDRYLERVNRMKREFARLQAD
jgi:hypothetical protein